MHFLVQKTQMLAKSANFSFGVGFSCFLVLLAISTCLLSCANAASVTLEKKPLQIAKEVLAKQINNALTPNVKSQRLFDAYPEIDLTKIITSDPSNQLKLQPVADLSSGKISCFEILLPLGKTIEQYVEALFKQPLQSTSESPGEIEKELAGLLSKTAQEVGLKNSKPDRIVKRFPELTKLLYQNFVLYGEDLYKLNAPTNNAPKEADVKNLFSIIFQKNMSEYEALVYLPPTMTPKQFVASCADKVNERAKSEISFKPRPLHSLEHPRDAIGFLWNQVLEGLDTRETPSAVEVKWSDIFNEMTLYTCVTENIIELAVGALSAKKFGELLFKFELIECKPNLYEKFFIFFENVSLLEGASEDESLLDFLFICHRSRPRGATFTEALGRLIRNYQKLAKKPIATGPDIIEISPNAFFKKNSDTLSWLRRLIDTHAKIKTCSMVKVADIAAPNGSPFTSEIIDGKEAIKCAEFPCKSDDAGTVTDAERINGYINFILALKDAKSKSIFNFNAQNDEIKKVFFDSFWSAENLDGYAKFLVPIVVAKPPIVESSKDATPVTPSSTSKGATLAGNAFNNTQTNQKSNFSTSTVVDDGESDDSSMQNVTPFDKNNTETLLSTVQKGKENQGKDISNITNINQDNSVNQLNQSNKDETQKGASQIQNPLSSLGGSGVDLTSNAEDSSKKASQNQPKSKEPAKSSSRFPIWALVLFLAVAATLLGAGYYGYKHYFSTKL